MYIASMFNDMRGPKMMKNGKTLFSLLVVAAFFSAASCAPAANSCPADENSSMSTGENDELSQKEEMIHSLEEENSGLKSKLEEASGKIDELNSDNSGLNNEISKRDETISELEHSIAEMDSENKELDKTNSEKDNQISELEKEKSELENSNSDKDEQIAELEKSLSEEEKLNEELREQEGVYIRNECGFLEKEDSSMILLEDWRETNSGMSNYINLNGRSEDMTFELMTYAGSLHYEEYDGKIWKPIIVKPMETCTLMSGERPTWTKAGSPYTEQTYIDIVAKCGESITGYALVRIQNRAQITNPSYPFGRDHHATLIRAAYVKGDVSVEQINQKLANLRKGDTFGRIYSCDPSNNLPIGSTGFYEQPIADLYDLNPAGKIESDFYQIFHFTYGDPNTTFISKPLSGQLFLVQGGGDAGKAYEFFTEENVYWSRPYDYGKDQEFMNTSYTDFIETTIVTSGKIVGYGVLYVNSPDYQTVNITFVKSAIFPAIGGKLQAITQEFADSCMKTAEESYLDSIA